MVGRRARPDEGGQVVGVGTVETSRARAVRAVRAVRTHADSIDSHHRRAADRYRWPISVRSTVTGWARRTVTWS
jgi:hypothetical protein